jgi:hypothetical protein
VALEAQSARVAGVYNEPTGGEALVLGYAPDNGYRQNFTKSWNPQTGRYSVTADWVYTG